MVGKIEELGRMGRGKICKICGRQPGLVQADHTPFKFFKGCFPQILLGPFLNPLSHIYFTPDDIENTMGLTKT